MCLGADLIALVAVIGVPTIGIIIMWWCYRDARDL
jgi:hypothetical protein